MEPFLIFWLGQVLILLCHSKKKNGLEILQRFVWSQTILRAWKTAWKFYYVDMFFWSIGIILLQTSSHVKTKTHLYKQYQNKWFQILPSSFYHPPPPFNVTFVCVPVGRVGDGGGGEYSVQTMQDDKYIIFEVLCISFCWSCEPWCAHPCQWGTIEMTIIVIIMLG